jgi:hypothetical protein
VLHSGSHRRPGEWPVTAVEALAASELLLRDPSHAIDRLSRQIQHLHDIVVEHAHAATGDRVHGQIRLLRHAERAHDEHVQWGAESCSAPPESRGLEKRHACEA